mmetsp:Transcript_63097/g.70670  ORF Transcript_63097/g.70670 Transcript_63097/m.70670 type:complete len:130 (-) Transcript_63097:487-876(-)
MAIIKIDWVVPYYGPKEVTANVGDTICFVWQHDVNNVYIHPSLNCHLDGAICVGANSPVTYTFTEADGTRDGKDMFFSCDIGHGSNCRAGQNLIVTVHSDGADAFDPVCVTKLTGSERAAVAAYTRRRN